MKPEYFLNQMLEKINRAELNLFINRGNEEDSTHIDKTSENRL